MAKDDHNLGKIFKEYICGLQACGFSGNFSIRFLRQYVPLFASIDLILYFVVLLNVLSYRQDKRMDELNLFIEHYSKYIVSII